MKRVFILLCSVVVIMAGCAAPEIDEPIITQEGSDSRHDYTRDDGICYGGYILNNSRTISRATGFITL